MSEARPAIDLTKYGIQDAQEIVYNPSYEQLFEEETKPSLSGYEKGTITESGAVRPGFPWPTGIQHAINC